MFRMKLGWITSLSIFILFFIRVNGDWTSALSLLCSNITVHPLCLTDCLSCVESDWNAAWCPDAEITIANESVIIAGVQFGLFKTSVCWPSSPFRFINTSGKMELTIENIILPYSIKCLAYPQWAQCSTGGGIIYLLLVFFIIALVAIVALMSLVFLWFRRYKNIKNQGGIIKKNGNSRDPQVNNPLFFASGSLHLPGSGSFANLPVSSKAFTESTTAKDSSRTRSFLTLPFIKEEEDIDQELQPLDEETPFPPPNYSEYDNKKLTQTLKSESKRATQTLASDLISIESSNDRKYIHRGSDSVPNVQSEANSTAASYSGRTSRAADMYGSDSEDSV